MKARKSNFFTSMVVDLIVFIIVTFLVVSIVTIGILYYYGTYKNILLTPYADNAEMIDALRFEEIELERQLGPGGFYFVLDDQNNIYYQSNLSIDYPFTAEETEKIPNNVQLLNVYVKHYKHQDFGQVKMIEYTDDDSNILKMMLIDEEGQMVFSTDGKLAKLSIADVQLLTGVYKSFSVFSNNFVHQDKTYNIVFFNKGKKESQMALELINMFLVLFVAIVVIILLSTILFLIWLNRKVNKPLILLSKAFKEFKLDDHKIEYKGPREFIEICNKFNEMASRLSDAEGDKRRMLAGLSHDIRTPLTVLQTYSQALTSGMVPKDDQEEYLNIIHSKAGDMSVMVEELNHYSQLCHNDFELSKEPINFTELIRQYFIDRISEIELKGFNLDIDLTQNIHASVDAIQFKRVLENLLSNTLKYNHTGTNISITLGLKENLICLCFSDDGVGIDPNIKQQVFDAFVTNDLARTSGKGVGLGLSIVKKILELHDGSISLLERDSGTSFEILLPLATLK